MLSPSWNLADAGFSILNLGEIYMKLTTTNNFTNGYVFGQRLHSSIYLGSLGLRY